MTTVTAAFSSKFTALSAELAVSQDDGAIQLHVGTQTGNHFEFVSHTTSDGAAGVFDLLLSEPPASGSLGLAANPHARSFLAAPFGRGIALPSVQDDAEDGQDAVVAPSPVPVAVLGSVSDSLAAVQSVPGGMGQSEIAQSEQAQRPAETASTLDGNSEIFTDSDPHTVTLTVPDFEVAGGDGLLTVIASAGDETIMGGAGGLAFSDVSTLSTGVDYLSTTAGATDDIALFGDAVVNSAGDDTITGGAGDQTITVIGRSTVVGGSGSSTYTLDGSDALVSQTAGTDQITVGAGAHARVFTSTAAQIDLTDTDGSVFLIDTAGGGRNVLFISGGTVTLTDVAGQAAEIATGSAGGSSITFIRGTEVLQSAGTDTISAGAANLTMSGTGMSTVRGGTGTFTYTGGSGSMTFIGGAGSAVITGGSGSLDVIGGTGGVTLADGSGDSTFVAGAGDAGVTEGAGASTVQFGTGNTTVTGGSGTDTYQFVDGSGGGLDVIQGFKVGQDQLVLQGFGTTAVVDETVVDGSMLLTLPDATQVSLPGVTSLADDSLQPTTTDPVVDYPITLGATQQNLLGPLTLPAATITVGENGTLIGSSGDDVFDAGPNAAGNPVLLGNGGDDVFYVYNYDVVDADTSGMNTVIESYVWGTYDLPDNVQNLIYDGTASWTNGYLSLAGNALDDTIVGNNLGDRFIAGAGDDTLVGGVGADIFVITGGYGSDTIVNFNAADVVDLQNINFVDFAAFQAAMQQLGDNTVISLGGEQTLTLVDQQRADLTPAEFGFSANGGGIGGVTTFETNPTIVQPTTPGQVLGFTLRDNGWTAIDAHEVTFGETFSAGQVPAGSQLVVTINGQQEAVQMDVKTTNADGSVAMAVLTLLQPALAGEASVNAMLSLASGTSSPPPITLATLTTSNYNVEVTLDMHNADGSITPYTLNAAELLQQALTAGTVTYILQGSQVTEGQFTVPISGSMYLAFDVSRFADGSTATNIAFNNDIAMSASGGTVTYDATIMQNGTVALQQNNITQYQYQSWYQEVYSNGAPQAQVVHDITALEKTGAIPDYDLSVGINTTAIASEGSQIGGPTYGILGSASVDTSMPSTGGRPDIGPQPQWVSNWLETQDPIAETYALDQAAAAGSVPWNFFSAQTGNYLTLNQYPTLWVDPRAAGDGLTSLTQAVPTDTGWYTDPAHQPDLSYVAYLMTGDQQYLGELNAQAAWSEIDDWSDPRQNGLGLVANGQDQVRQSAWSLREIDEAAYANPDGSAMKSYFTEMENNNWQWLVSQIPTWTAEEGQAYGYIPGGYSAGVLPPWQQDYFVSTAVEAVEQGNQDALTFLNWEANFIVGRFLNADNGFNPQDGIAYNLTVDNAAGVPLTTWAAIEQASEAAGQTNNSTWDNSQGDYGQLAEESLAEIISVTQSTSAMQAYGWLLASGAPLVNASAIAGTQFDIVPRLSDGNLLTASDDIISTDTIATTLSGSQNDQLIEAGSGNDTLNGGSGINLLFGGSGNDLLNGGSGNDYLFAGSGADTLSAGAGANFMQAGSGADTFVLSASDVATDLIAGFKVGTDHLEVAGASSPFVAQLITTATQGSMGAVLQLSSSHTVTLQGIAVSQVTRTVFA